ncbi:MAG: tetratricopeptide repeat protein [Bryobacteraceae bacterium]
MSGLAAALIIFCLGAVSVGAQDSSTLAAECERLAAAGNIAAARETVERLLASRPAPAEALLRAGQALGGVRQYDLAERAFRAVLDADPQSKEGSYNLGLTLYRAGRPNEAAPYLERITKAVPRFFDAHFVLGASLQAAGRREAAVRALRGALQLKPDHVGVLSLLGALYSELGFPLDAVDSLKMAVAQQPKNVKAGLLLVAAYHDSFEFAQAAALAERLVAAAPESAELHARLGYELQTAGNLDRAREELETAFRLDPQSLETRRMLGQVLLKSGDAGQALPLLEAAASAGDAPARLDVAKALVALKRWEAADQTLAPLTAVEAAAPAALLLHAQVLFRLGKPSESARLRERYLKASESTRSLAGGMGRKPALRRFPD